MQNLHGGVGTILTDRKIQQVFVSSSSNFLIAQALWLELAVLAGTLCMSTKTDIK